MKSRASLTRRLLLSLFVALVLFFGLTILLLDTVFRDLSERSLRELLDAQMVALISAAEPEEVGVMRAAATLESRLETPGSGLYAEIRDATGESVWRSPSMAGSGVAWRRLAQPGERHFEVVADGERGRLAIATRGISWEVLEGSPRRFTFSVASDLRPYEAQLRRFRQQIIGWFAGLAVLLVLTLALLMRWVLAPIRRLETEIKEVESGRREQLGAGWPRELAPVTTNLNALLEAERIRIKRYRDTLGNLAHSLKTPLAVMRSALERTSVAPSPLALRTEIDRMSAIIEHQMRRAATSGGQLLGQAPCSVLAIATELRTALLKVHGAKDLSIAVRVDPAVHFVGDRADLTESLGNLLDNACTWCVERVRVVAEILPEADSRRALSIVVEDDGAGISPENRERVLTRGGRLDETVPGHGLGLAMVQETAALYGGSLVIGVSEWGGARLELILPGVRSSGT
ncbi:MAG: ATP-binding protein [Steroidobacteraceae bacterium]|nr:ATP-binding protein [Steroidobacteraceae bacterium]